MAKQQRSPKYPFIPLDKAIERVRQLYQVEGRAPVALPVAVKQWGYAEKSSGGQQTVGALIQYGLVDDQGTGPNRHLKLTDRALRIILDERPDSTEKVQNIKVAALSPGIFSKLWEKWGTTGLPSAASMKHTLIFDHKFTDTAAAEVARLFSQTATFAGLAAGDVGGDNSPDEGEETNEIDLPDASTGGQGGHKATLNMKQDTIHLDEGMAVLRWPANISPSSAQDLEDFLNLALRRIKRAAEAATQNDEKRQGKDQ